MDFELIGRIARALPVGIVLVSGEGNVTYVNTAAEMLLSISQDEALNKPVRHIVPETELDRVLADGKTRVRYPHSHACRMRTIAVAIVDERGEVCGGMESYEEYQENKTLTTQVRNLQAQCCLLDSILNTAFEDIAAVDSNGRLTYISPKTANKLGVERNDVIGTSMKELRRGCLMEEVARTGVAQMGELWKVKNTSVPAVVLPIIEYGQIQGAVCKSVFRDIEHAREVLRAAELENRLRLGKNTRGAATYNFDDIVGESSSILFAKDLAQRAASGNSTVLLLAESGCGKELFAHAIHSASVCRSGPFVPVNCASIPESLLESELFGYDEGAFTGASKGGKPGKFELADGGTIFLDEIGDMGSFMQAKLLRVLQEGEIQKVGAGKVRRVNVRVIAATNADLADKVSRGEFREDLYYRLDVITISIPPLRERRGDVDLLIDHLLPRLAAKHGEKTCKLNDAVREDFTSYDWPGNVRELLNVLEAAVCLGAGQEINRESLPPHFVERLKRRNVNGVGLDTGNGFSVDTSAACGGCSLAELEKRAIAGALDATKGNKRKAATMLGLARSTFYEKLRRHSISW